MSFSCLSSISHSVGERCLRGLVVAECLRKRQTCQHPLPCTCFRKPTDRNHVAVMLLDVPSRNESENAGCTALTRWLTMISPQDISSKNSNCKDSQGSSSCAYMPWWSRWATALQTRSKASRTHHLTTSHKTKSNASWVLKRHLSWTWWWVKRP